MRSHRARLAYCAVALILAGCASIAPRPPPDRAYAGRFSATAAKADKQDTVSGRFTLEMRGHNMLLDLATPLGSTVARIEVDASGARVSGSQVRSISGPDADALTAELLGWRLPVSGLPDWIEGRAASGSQFAASTSTADAQGRIEHIEQDGWSIRVLERFDDDKPRRLLIERPSSNSEPAVTLRLVLDSAGF